MTTSASLLTSVYRTLCAGTNVRLRERRKSPRCKAWAPVSAIDVGRHKRGTLVYRCPLSWPDGNPA